METRRKRVNYRCYYEEWLFSRRTLQEISDKLGISIRKLRQEFDKIEVLEGVCADAPKESINLLIDATYFGREYGFIVFHDTNRVIYFHEIELETVKDLRDGLTAIMNAGFRIKSVTIDGRRGFYSNIKKVCGNIPVQMCMFHQTAIIRRYITNNPKSKCGKELKDLMTQIKNADQKFINDFYALKEKYKQYLNQKNDNGEFKHQSLRSAFRSLQTILFTILY